MPPKRRNEDIITVENGKNFCLLFNNVSNDLNIDRRLVVMVK